MRKYLKSKYYKDYLRRIFLGRYKRSYSQQGEDLLIQSALGALGISNPTYLDIGAYDPILSNNTYLFYTQGSRGVCIEPDPDVFNVIKQKRKNDICLNIGIGSADEENAQYYVMSTKQMSTFKKDEVDLYTSNPAYGSPHLLRVLSIPLVPVNTILERYFSDGLDILSIDTEGFDVIILSALDFAKYRPNIICVETLRYDAGGDLQKSNEIIEGLTNAGYSIYADTHVNTIFTRNQAAVK